MNPSELKQRLKALKTEKGIASRAVGEARRAGQPIGPAVERVKALSRQLRELESQIAAASRRDAPEEQPAAAPEPLPPQFTGQDLQPGDGTPLRIDEAVSDAEWDAWVAAHPRATIYHGSAIRRVIEDSFGHAPHYLAVRDDSGRIQGLLPLIEMQSRLFGHFLVSMPFFNYGGLLADSIAARDRLVAAAAERARALDVEHVEYRHCFDELALPARSEKVAMLRPLPKSADRLWADIGSKVRAQVNKARKHGLSTRTGREELLDDFYRVFARNMRDLGTPVYGIALFRNMLRHCESSYLVMVYRNGLPVSGGFLLGWRNTLEIPWASTLRSANRFDANMLLYWTVLESAIERGYEVFDFGRSSRNSNTLRFKKQWGARPQPLYWHYWLPEGRELPSLNPNNPKFRLMVAAWKRLPVPLARLIGPAVVSKIP
jgi:FemAB-related protein (PEP-CTERM system-associated)